MPKTRTEGGVKANPLKPRWIYRHENELMRALAGWAVSQHPYHKPPGLFTACWDFVHTLANTHRSSMRVIRLHTGTIRKHVSEFCRTNPIVRRWNKPKKGRHTMVFTSCYNEVNPEFDFIDLDALAGNIVRQLLRED